MAAAPCAAAIFLSAAIVVAGCVSVTVEPRAVLERDDGSLAVQTLACAHSAAATSPRLALHSSTLSLDPDAIRIASWNVHKQFDAGWQDDLAALIRRSDVVLLQEIVLDARLRDIIDDAGLRWVMASSFLQLDVDIGVLTAARTAPLASCTQRIVEPLLRLPKSAIITWFPLTGRDETLAVANVHAINFAFTLGAYRAQFDALADALAEHRGPLILAGDLNTWTTERANVVRDVAQRLDLTEVPFAVDRRSVFFGHQLDHIFVRGLVPVEATSRDVTSSDHNPVAATLRAAK